jgi:hypothetical protein
MNILGERLSEALQKLKSNPNSAGLLSKLTGFAQFSENFGGGTTLCTPGFVKAMGLEEYGLLAGNSSDEEIQDNEDISTRDGECLYGEEEGETAERQVETEDDQGTQEAYGVEKQFTDGMADDGVDHETWFLDTFSSISHCTESLWVPPDI